jgi:transcriptional regulator GlxA family with amidase domain
VRLDHAHDQLRRSGPHQVTVAAVAYRWGFTHPGDFTRRYQTRHGVPPWHTLRGSDANPRSRNQLWYTIDRN